MPVSVVIAARNEAENINRFLPAVLGQEHPEFEVILVNDGSQDKTKDLLRRVSDPRLRVFNLKQHVGKKAALTEGIRHARYGNILLTDADCRPVSRQWLWWFDQVLQTKDVAVGVSQYLNSGSFLDEMIQFETLFTVKQMDAANMILGKPHMAVGRNLGFRKAVFESTGGYGAHQDIPYGDDDLFINSLGAGVSVVLLHSYTSQTVSVPVSGWKQWFRQKRRHYSSGLSYKGKNLWFALIWQQTWLWLNLLWLTAWLFSLKLFFVLIVYKVVSWSYTWYCCRKYRFGIRRYLTPIYEVLFLFYFLIAGISVIFAKKDEWI